MNYVEPFSCVATDSGLASEVYHVSPVFVRCGPRTRGAYADRRLTRARRSAERHEQGAPGARRELVPPAVENRFEITF